MKTILSLFIACLGMAAQAQPGWFAGAEGRMFSYRLYNYNDWNLVIGGDEVLVIKQAAFDWSNYGAGLEAGYAFSDWLELSLGIVYTEQEQFHTRVLDYGSSVSERQIGNGSLSLSYLSLPLTLRAITPGDRHSFYVDFSIINGMLTDYRLQYEESYIFAPGSLESFTIIHTGPNYQNFIHNWYDPNVAESLEQRTDWAYSHYQFGLGGSLGYRYHFNEGWAASFGLFGTYDFTDAENKDAQVYGDDGVALGPYDMTGAHWAHGDGTYDTRPASHNVRFGISLGLRYYFDGGAY